MSGVSLSTCWEIGKVFILRIRIKDANKVPFGGDSNENIFSSHFCFECSIQFGFGALQPDYQLVYCTIQMPHIIWSINTAFYRSVSNNCTRLWNIQNYICSTRNTPHDCNTVRSDPSALAVCGTHLKCGIWNVHLRTVQLGHSLLN